MVFRMLIMSLPPAHNQESASTESLANGWTPLQDVRLLGLKADEQGYEQAYDLQSEDDPPDLDGLLAKLDRMVRRFDVFDW